MLHHGDISSPLLHPYICPASPINCTVNLQKFYDKHRTTIYYVIIFITTYYIVIIISINQFINRYVYRSAVSYVYKKYTVHMQIRCFFFDFEWMIIITLKSIKFNTIFNAMTCCLLFTICGRIWDVLPTCGVEVEIYCDLLKSYITDKMIHSLTKYTLLSLKVVLHNRVKFKLYVKTYITHYT